MMQVLLVTICLAVFPYQGSSIILESGNVNDYDIVYPQKLTAMPKGAIQQPEQKYEDAMQYKFEVNGKPVVLHLEKNKDLFSKDYSETHYSPDGKEITTNPPVEDHCYYHGRIQTDAHSSASISACNGLKGYFRLRGETYFIEPLKVPDSEAHAVFKYENIKKEDEAPKMCGVTHTNWESDEPIEKSSQLVATSAQHRFPKRFVEYLLIVDFRTYMKYDNDSTVIRTRAYEMVNNVNEILSALNIRVPLVGLEIWSQGDLINVLSSSDDTLDLFGEWRQRNLMRRKGHDNAHLLTALDFDGPTIGLGYIGTMCQRKFSVAVIQDHGEINFVASTIAHEMGHNLGIRHDTRFCTCNDSSCVMAAHMSLHPLRLFSNCSEIQYQRFITHINPRCIINEPLKTDIISPPVCGNELLEVGEDCDCGSPETCQDTCCDAASCKLQSWVECESGECCDQCKFKRAGTECRPAKDDCDMAESCTGQSSECPVDNYHENGQPCLHNLGYCYNGKCPIKLYQCMAFFGRSAVGVDESCFEYNRLGNTYAYCRKENGVKIPCAPEDQSCGRLYCSYSSFGSNIPCLPCYRADEEDKGMVDEGTKCGNGKVCSNGRCVDLNIAY